MREKELKHIENLLLLKVKKEKIEETDKIKEYLKRFEDERRFDGIKESTIKSDLDRLRVFLDYCINYLGKNPEELKTSDFVKFFNYLDTVRKVSKSSQRKYFLLLKVFYRVLRMYNVIQEFVEESKDRKRFARIEIQHYDAVDAEMLNMILKKIIESGSRTRIRDALIIRLLWDTGCRVSEVLNLKYKDCDLDNGIFKIRNTKTHEERTVVCSSDTLELLRNYVQFNVRQGSDDYLFQNSQGGRVRKEWISEVFRKAVNELKEEGKIPKNRRIVIHSIRHGRAVDLLNKGVPIDIVKEYLGHKSMNTTLIYAHSKERAESLEFIKKLLRIQ
ncbi:integrase/recombinase [Methanocaldococcus jannaschii DSM 2661]|uniref:Probable integrase/recombinase protein MJ0367 n=1 Tax=Methanocaldococcus jannaschii (strain ATCC 43067 / DSM 2661 / JAL-1 / JCM 10045 / NBRC 100440) TaxID=243232 RepID=Y367_METJA|nr:site-specific integrase [Methanocaldococcus jannaschii]Q57813.1 RecName: Full=Probable integrase/recombinase protein MJ0367 [Methanocaldococcus jannaschii DSM 2661]AAB98346.1 integrase/recombinase [Methanocaldococcus jannaschii DSM 2661]